MDDFHKKLMEMGNDRQHHGFLEIKENKPVIIIIDKAVGFEQRLQHEHGKLRPWKDTDTDETKKRTFARYKVTFEGQKLFWDAELEIIQYHIIPVYGMQYFNVPIEISFIKNCRKCPKQWLVRTAKNSGVEEIDSLRDKINNANKFLASSKYLDESTRQIIKTETLTLIVELGSMYDKFGRQKPEQYTEQLSKFQKSIGA